MHQASARPDMEDERASGDTKELEYAHIPRGDLARVLARIVRSHRLAGRERLSCLAAPDLAFVSPVLANGSCRGVHARPQIRCAVVGVLYLVVLIVDTAKPGLLPIDSAACLASTVSGAIAAKIFQIHGLPHPPRAGTGDRVANLLDSS